jgi:sec-independent protein translocase protein TatA
MNMMILGMLNGWEIVLIFAVILVLFGAKKLPELARGMGQGLKEFKKATHDVTEELQSAMDMDTPPPQSRKFPHKESQQYNSSASDPSQSGEAAAAGSEGSHQPQSDSEKSRTVSQSSTPSD